MEKMQLLEFENLLKEKIKSLLNKQHDLNVDEDGDEIDAAQSALIMDMAYINRSRINGEIQRLNDSLAKIKEGCFGECEECGEDIPVKRLQICLDAKYCIRCAELIEQHGSKKHND